MVAEASEQPQSQLGRYRILKHLASGGMAEVFLATATGIEGFERHVVIKRIHREHAKHQAFVQMFLDEARLAASLHHHNVVQVHDIGQDNGEYFYAMEYVHGEDVRGLLMRVRRAQQLVPLEHVVTIVNAAAAGLHYAHEHRGPDRRPLNIVHRDVSPSNIIIDYDGNVKVVDFGIAKATTKTDRTRSGVLKGKVAYMSPEQCKGANLDRRSDIYALGIVLYELTTARRLFKGENDFMTMSAIVAGKVPPPSSRRPDLPPELEQIIMKALAKEPVDRFQTAHEMRQALDGFVASTGIRASTTGLADYMEATFGGRRREPWLDDTPIPVADLDADFDGSSQGVAYVSASAVDHFVNGSASAVRTSSPLLKARNKALPDLHEAVTPEVTRPGHIASSASMMSAAEDPMILPRRTSRGWVIAVVAVTVIAAGVYFAPELMPRDDAQAPQPKTPPPPQDPPPTPQALAPAPPPTPLPAPSPTATPPPPVENPVDETPAREPAAPPVVEKSLKPKPLIKPTRKRPPVKKKPDGDSQKTDPNWTPDNLLPE